MGFLDWLFGQPQNQIPTVETILPSNVVNEILQGRLVHINTDKLFMKRGEICHYADRAILLVDKKEKTYTTTSYGGSVPGLLKGNRVHHSYSEIKPNEYIVTERHPGILYITNKRIVFSSKSYPFDKQYRYLSSVKPYLNAIELQYGSIIYSIIVPDGNVAYSVIKMLQ